MLANIKKDFENGLQKVKWFSSLLAERVNIEISIFRLLYQSEELKKRRSELLAKIGQQVYEFRNKDIDVYSISEVRQAIKELDEIDTKIHDTVAKAEELSRVTSS